MKSWCKIPGTSEFLDWVAILKREQQAKKLTSKELESTHPANLPHLETLVKTQSDRDALNNLKAQDG